MQIYLLQIKGIINIILNNVKDIFIIYHLFGLV